MSVFWYFYLLMIADTYFQLCICSVFRQITKIFINYLHDSGFLLDVSVKLLYSRLNSCVFVRRNRALFFSWISFSHLVWCAKFIYLWKMPLVITESWNSGELRSSFWLHFIEELQCILPMIVFNGDVFLRERVPSCVDFNGVGAVLISTLQILPPQII